MLTKKKKSKKDKFLAGVEQTPAKNGSGPSTSSGRGREGTINDKSCTPCSSATNTENEKSKTKKANQLAAGILSGEISKDNLFLAKQSPLSCTPGKKEPTNSMGHKSKSGTGFGYKGSWIQFNQLSLKS